MFKPQDMSVLAIYHLSTYLPAYLSTYVPNFYISNEEMVSEMEREYCCATVEDNTFFSSIHRQFIQTGHKAVLNNEKKQNKTHKHKEYKMQLSWNSQKYKFKNLKSFGNVNKCFQISAKLEYHKKYLKYSDRRTYSQ